MFNRPSPPDVSGSELLVIIRGVRNRWRMKAALRGLAVVVGAGLGAFLLSSYGLEYFRFSPPAVVTFRIVTYVVLVGLVVVFLVIPLMRRVSDEQVALYLEEHEPSLEAAVVSALEETRRGTPADRRDHSPALIARLVESAVERCEAIEAGRRVERQSLYRSSGLLAGLAAVAMATLLFGPAYLRHGLSTLMFPARSVEAASPYRIDVQPGTVTIARGSDQTITAQLVGFDSEDVQLFTRAGPSAPFERLPLIPVMSTEEDGGFEVMLFDIDEPLDYFVQANGVRSSMFGLSVEDLPYVQRLELEYHFPAYTGLPPRTVEDGGDIAVLQDTEVRLRAFPTMSTPRGTVVRGESDSRDLAREADGTLTGGFSVDAEGFYRIELEGPNGDLVAASPQYTIDVLTDQAPVVSFVKPGRDTTASPIEEIFVEARADDDFGVQRLELAYSVNGGPQQTIRLFAGGQPARKEVSAGHTFFLEELELEPGDFISYHARVTDNRATDAAHDVASDLYFIQIRPFGKDFRPAQTQAGMGGGAGGASPGALSETQRQVISATFNVVRDQAQYSAEEYREHLVLLTLSQGRLREQVETLVARLGGRGVIDIDPAFESIAEILPKAVTEMRAAEELLQAQDADAALAPEQRALQHLQRAEEVYREVQVTLGNSGGGGGGSSSTAEDLADLFELELDKLQNQYETLQRGQQQATDNQIDEALERLKELARRQEQEAERRRRTAGRQSAGTGAAGQRALASEAEEAARRLERLARENPSPALQDAARRMQEAADAMRRAAARGGEGGLADAAAALERLRDAQRRLEGDQAGRLERDIEDARRRVAELAGEQETVTADVGGLGDAGESRDARISRLMERKDAMAAEVADLERQIDRTAADFRREQQAASRKLQEAADSIRDNKLKEKLRYSKGLIQGREPAFAHEFEQQIGADLAELQEKLGEAAGAVGTSETDALTEALDQAGDLVRGMESLDQRMRETGGQPAETEGGESGETGGQGEAGAAAGLPSSAGGASQGRPGPFNADAIRQFRRELRERTGEAQSLRGALSDQGIEAGDLDEIIQAMRALDSERVYADPEEIARLQRSVIEALKTFEYRLRREVEAEEEQLYLTTSDEVPEGFRSLIEEYYRSLSRESPP